MSPSDVLGGTTLRMGSVYTQPFWGLLRSKGWGGAQYGRDSTGREQPQQEALGGRRLENKSPQKELT